MTVRKESRIALAVPHPTAYTAAYETLQRQQWTIEVADAPSGQLKAMTQSSLLSFGERIEIRVIPSSEASSVVFISSESRLSTTLVDYGMNQKNLDGFGAALLANPRLNQQIAYRRQDTMGVQLIDHLGRTYEVIGKQVTLGADSGNGIVIPEFAVPGPALELVNDGTGWVLNRVNHGVEPVVNGVPVKETVTVHHLDVIQAPGVSLRFVDTGRMSASNDRAAERQGGQIVVQPQYQQPVYQQSDYQQPVYQQPVDQQPMYQQPVYQQSVYPQQLSQQSVHVYLPQVQGGPPSKDKTAAALLAILLGGLGAHHFYLGHIALGIFYILFSWTFIPAIIGFIEGIVYLTTSDERWLQQYPPR